MNSSTHVSLLYNSGTILIRTDSRSTAGFLNDLSECMYDKRLQGWRCLTLNYRMLIERLRRAGIPYTDSIRGYNQLALSRSTFPEPYDYQTAANEAWMNGKWGVVVLPTGAGKSLLAAMCIADIQRSALVIVPTISLMFQWQKTLGEWFDIPVGALGGGASEITDITVSTYDSARIHLKKLATRFCLVVFDECHHLPAPAYADAATGLICPYRLGLTATPPDDPQRYEVMRQVTGDICYRREIRELSGSFLSDYKTHVISVRLTDEEREAYEYHRAIYLTYRSKMIRWGLRDNSPWKDFVALAGRSKEGRNALKSFARQKDIAGAASQKLEVLKEIILKHRHERILIFTNDNKTGFLISTAFLIPQINHETPSAERKKILQHFKCAERPYLVSSKVLNEGIDVPEARVAVIISGNSTVREHVQRLGRILRKKKDGKRAILYEIVTEETGEVFTSRKRRMHEAYH